MEMPKRLIERLKELLHETKNTGYITEDAFISGFYSCFNELAPILQEMRDALEYYDQRTKNEDEAEIAINALEKYNELMK